MFHLNERLVLVVFGIFGCSMALASDLSIENKVDSLEKKMDHWLSLLDQRLLLLDQRLLLLEDTVDVFWGNKNNPVPKGLLLESRLADLTAEVQKYGEKLARVSGRVDDVESKSERNRNHFELQMELLNSSTSAAVQKIERVSKKVAGELEKEQLRTDSLQDELNDTRHELRSFLVAHGVALPTVDHLRMGVDPIQKLEFNDIHSSLTHEIRHIEKSVSKLQTDCVGHEPVSRLNGSLQNVGRTLKHINRSLRQHASLIGSLDGQLEALNCTGEPPSLQHGKPVDVDRRLGAVVRYQCDSGFVLTGNSTVRCRFGNWEGQVPGCRFFDATFILRAHHGNRFNEIHNVTCSSEENDQKIEFSRILDTGTGVALPSGAKTYTLGKTAVFDLSGVDGDDKVGAYQCGYGREGKRKGITFAINRVGDFVWPRLTSIGDTVELDPSGFDEPSLRWFHDGERIPAGDGKGMLTISGVRADDAGIYEEYDAGDWRDYQWFYRLVVRGCPAKFFGERCDRDCPTCLNGGVCHDLLGSCVCPPGFVGSSCEVACGENRVGPNCSESCHGGDCKGQVFCKPNPFGCSCAAGYEGRGCLKMQEWVVRARLQSAMPLR